MAEPARKLAVEVVYAMPDQQVLLALEVEDGATARDAIAACGILDRFPDLDPASMTIGIFGRTAGPETRLNNGDRVEIYRPLLADPKEVRRRRAKPPGARSGT
jgi:putative ubiquitin-RnfH superfamily antitoxin RatB of RatAB toxin-antitoxin module